MKITNYPFPVVSVDVPEERKIQPKAISKLYKKSELVEVDTDELYNYCDMDDDDEDNPMDTNLDNYAIALEVDKNWALAQDKHGRPILIALKGNKGKK